MIGNTRHGRHVDNNLNQSRPPNWNEDLGQPLKSEINSKKCVHYLRVKTKWLNPLGRYLIPFVWNIVPHLEWISCREKRVACTKSGRVGSLFWLQSRFLVSNFSFRRNGLSRTKSWIDDDDHHDGDDVHTQFWVNFTLFLLERSCYDPLFFHFS